RPMLYHNDGDGSFTDVTAASGIGAVKPGFGLTAVAADLDGDGWQDIYVACDSTPSLLFHNRGDGTFAEQGLLSGLAVNEDGNEQAGMGVAIGDFDTDGRLDALKTHFAEDTVALYRNTGHLGFEDVTLRRGVACGDFDNDGDLDILIMNINEPPSLLRNDVRGGGRWLKVKLVGTRSNTSAVGSVVTAVYGERRQAQAVLASSGYLSCGDRRLHFGLGTAAMADLEIAWPSGAHESVKGLRANQLVTVKEGVG